MVANRVDCPEKLGKSWRAVHVPARTPNVDAFRMAVAIQLGCSGDHSELSRMTFLHLQQAFAHPTLHFPICTCSPPAKRYSNESLPLNSACPQNCAVQNCALPTYH